MDAPIGWDACSSLILVAAVTRHGANDWQAVSDIMKKHPFLRTVENIGYLFSSAACKSRYADLVHSHENVGQSVRTKRAARYSTDDLEDTTLLTALKSERIAELGKELKQHNDLLKSLASDLKKVEIGDMDALLPDMLLKEKNEIQVSPPATPLLSTVPTSHTPVTITMERTPSKTTIKTRTPSATVIKLKLDSTDTNKEKHGNITPKKANSPVLTDVHGEPNHPPKEKTPSQTPKQPPHIEKETPSLRQRETRRNTGVSVESSPPMPPLQVRVKRKRGEVESKDVTSKAPIKSETRPSKKARKETESIADRLLEAWTAISCHEDATIFRDPVVVEGYSEVVKVRRDLSQIKQDLDKKTISAPIELLRELLYMFACAFMFNEIGSEAREVACTMKEFAKEILFQRFPELAFEFDKPPISNKLML